MNNAQIIADTRSKLALLANTNDVAAAIFAAIEDYDAGDRSQHTQDTVNTLAALHDPAAALNWNVHPWLLPAVEQQTDAEWDAEIDAVNHPQHYVSHESGVECIEITEHMGFNLGNASKYLWRRSQKNAEAQDISKALWYVNREIERRTRETWATFPIDERYEVSSAGRIRNKESGRIRASVPLKSGYHTFGTVVDGKHVLHYVHRAVAETFLGGIPEGMQVCHNDGDRSNNHITNLRIDTPKNNARDKRKHGTHYVGGQNPSAKLDAETVMLIRGRTESESRLAAEFGVSRTTIGRIRRGESWYDPRLEQERAFDRWLSFEPEGDLRDAAELIWRAGLDANPVANLERAASLLAAAVESQSAA